MNKSTIIMLGVRMIKAKRSHKAEQMHANWMQRRATAETRTSI